MRIGNTNHPHVGEPQFKEIKRLVEGTLGGDRLARLHLHEHLTTGDSSIFAVAALTNVQVIQQYEEATKERNWNKIATVRSVDDFETPRFYTFESSAESKITGNSRKGKGGEADNPAHIMPVVPESSPYPTFNLKAEKLSTEIDVLRKRGGRFSISWERFLKDPDNIIAQLPTLFTDSFLDAEDWEVWSTFRSTLDTNGTLVGLKSGTTVFGDSVPADSKITRDALEVALRQLREREYEGRRMGLSEFKLIVPIGVAEDVRLLVSLWTPGGIKTDPTTGEVWNLNYPAPGWNPLNQISEIVETEHLTGTEWAIVATPPAGKRPGLELLKLQGHELPDIRIKGDQGFRSGGGSVGVFEGSFDTDDIEIRGRLPIQAVSWEPRYYLYSDGSK